MTPLLDLLQWLNVLDDAFAWLSVGLFLVVAVLDATDRRTWARRAGAVTWTVFGVFWLTLVHYYVFEQRSVVEGFLSIAALPACIYVGYLLYRGRDSLFVLSRSILFMGLIFLPFDSIPFLRQWIIETVTVHTDWLMGLFGYDPVVTEGPLFGYRSQYEFTTDGHRYVTYIEIVCSGIGSIAIFGGLAAAVKAPLRRKLKALAVVVPVVYALNILRNAFIAVAFGKQWMQFFVPRVQSMAGYDDPGMVSFFLADRVISQGLSVVVLVALALVIARMLPELFVVVDDVLYVLTGREWNLRERLGGGGGGSGGAGGAGGGGGAGDTGRSDGTGGAGDTGTSDGPADDGPAVTDGGR